MTAGLSSLTTNAWRSSGEVMSVMVDLIAGDDDGCRFGGGVDGM